MRPIAVFFEAVSGPTAELWKSPPTFRNSRSMKKKKKGQQSLSVGWSGEGHSKGGRAVMRERVLPGLCAIPCSGEPGGADGHRIGAFPHGSPPECEESRQHRQRSLTRTAPASEVLFLSLHRARVPFTSTGRPCLPARHQVSGPASSPADRQTTTTTTTTTLAAS